MVPLMAAMLLVVVASQVPKLGDSFSDVVRVVPFYVLFLVVMPFAGILVARVFGLDVPSSRAPGGQNSDAVDTDLTAVSTGHLQHAYGHHSAKRNPYGLETYL